jgi:hypothetical protein
MVIIATLAAALAVRSATAAPITAPGGASPDTPATVTSWGEGR